MLHKKLLLIIFHMNILLFAVLKKLEMINVITLQFTDKFVFVLIVYKYLNRFEAGFQYYLNSWTYRRFYKT